MEKQLSETTPRDHHNRGHIAECGMLNLRKPCVARTDSFALIVASLLALLYEGFRIRAMEDPLFRFID